MSMLQIDFKCVADVDQRRDDITKSLLVVEHLSEVNGEHVTLSLKTSRDGLPRREKFYRLTLEEIPCPSAPSS